MWNSKPKLLVKIERSCVLCAHFKMNTSHTSLSEREEQSFHHSIEMKIRITLRSSCEIRLYLCPLPKPCALSIMSMCRCAGYSLMRKQNIEVSLGRFFAHKLVELLWKIDGRVVKLISELLLTVPLVGITYLFKIMNIKVMLNRCKPAGAGYFLATLGSHSWANWS